MRKLDAALRAQRAILMDPFDDSLAGAAARITAVTDMERLLAQPEVRVLLQIELSGHNAPTMSLPEREWALRKKLMKRKKQR